MSEIRVQCVEMLIENLTRVPKPNKKSYSDRDAFRAHKKIYKRFVKRIPKIAKKIERSIYNWTHEIAKGNCIMSRWTNSKFLRIYQDKVRFILENLDETVVKNVHLISLVQKPEITSGLDLSRFSNFQIGLGTWSEIISLDKSRSDQTYRKKRKTRKGTWRCKQCKSWNTECMYMQLRSCDEPMTAVGECFDCGATWGCKRS